MPINKIKIILSLASLSLFANSLAAAEREPIDKKVAEIVSVFEDRGILTRKGTFVIEPSLSYSLSSSTVVAIEGFTILPALVVGLININQTQRDILNSSLAFRYGFTSYFEIGVKVPYIASNESIRERTAFEGSQIDIVHDTNGHDLGDVELSLSCQLNGGHDGMPYFIAGLRLKSDTGKSVFEIDTKELKDEEGEVIGIIFEEQPTGSGFWALQGGLTVTYPTDPAVLYGNLSYTWNREDDKGPELGGRIDPGDTIGVSFGIGFSINERTSFSLGYDHDIILQTEFLDQEDKLESRFERIHSGSLSLGISQAIGKSNNLKMSVSIGATEAAPDMQFTIRTPFAF